MIKFEKVFMQLIKKRPSYCQVTILFILLFFVAPGCKRAMTGGLNHVFVENGNPKLVIESGGEWLKTQTFISGTGINNYLVAGKELLDGDFQIHVRLSLDSLNNSAASFMLFGSHFGFDSQSKDGKSSFFVEGPLFEKNESFGESGKLIRPGRPFDLNIVGKDDSLTFSVNGEEVYSSGIQKKITRNLALRPWRNTLNVIDFNVTGNMVVVEPVKYLFESGTDGYNTFRIPAIIATNNGTLLAFAEGRKNGSSDTGDIDLVVKRSEDNGKTWSGLSVIWDDTENVCGNPAPVLDKTTGTIFLLSTWNLGTDHESEIIKQTSEDTRRIFILSSTDDGKTWSQAKEITESVKLKNWTWYATGPCHGIQLENEKHKGRLVVPCDHIESGTNKYFSHTIYSDDHGKTWKPGGITPQDQVNECTVAELSDGKLMLNMRNYDRTQKSRKVSVSNDGGTTWGDIYPDNTLIEPICQGSLLMYSFSGKESSKLLFLNPADENYRRNMTLRLSTDEGETWIKNKVLFSGPAAYSDLTVLPNGNIGCFYEAGIVHPYQGIVYQEITMQNLMK